MAVVVAAAARSPLVVRDWAPAIYILTGYFLSGRLFTAPSARFEQWLAEGDRRLLGDAAARFRAWPPMLLAYLDLVYMGCFVLVPAGYAVLAATGHAGLADRYWTMVELAEFGAFAPLALVQSRPPWALERKRDVPDGVVHDIAGHFVRKATIGANTFPSGHVAGSLTVAFSVVGAEPVAGVVLLVLALTIAVACFVGRYHYLIDVVAGVGLALLSWAIVTVLP
jgi:membrane-associated phospholipid phosphatase